MATLQSGRATRQHPQQGLSLATQVHALHQSVIALNPSLVHKIVAADATGLAQLTDQLLQFQQQQQQQQSSSSSGGVTVGYHYTDWHKLSNRSVR